MTKRNTSSQFSIVIYTKRRVTKSIKYTSSLDADTTVTPRWCHQPVGSNSNAAARSCVLCAVRGDAYPLSTATYTGTRTYV